MDSEEIENRAEEIDNITFQENLKLPLKPACALSLALPYAKAAKPGPDQCFAMLAHKEEQRRIQ